MYEYMHMSCGYAHTCEHFGSSIDNKNVVTSSCHVDIHIQYTFTHAHIWVVVKLMVPFWSPSIVRHLIFRSTQNGTIILTTTHIHIGTC